MESIPEPTPTIDYDKMCLSIIQEGENSKIQGDVFRFDKMCIRDRAGMEGFAGMYVRGGGPDQNLVMLDGIPVYNADHLLGVFLSLIHIL